jgi:hypothetical protein
MDTYKATNTTNGKFYIGSTTNFTRRKEEHLSSDANYPFQNALRNDPDVFEWEVWVDDCNEPVLEQALLDMWYGKECCYNLNPSASRPPTWEGRTGDLWWNNGEENKRSTVCPGEGWIKGVIREESAKHLDFVRSLGKTPWWTNGVDNKRCWVSPGEGWRMGKTWDVPQVSDQFIALWWTNGKDNKRSDKCPGEGWKRGITRKRRTTGKSS